MAMRWSRCVATVPPPATACRPATMRSSPSIRCGDPVGGEAGRHRREAVGFLDAQLVQAAHPRLAFGEGGGDGEDRIFVDHRGRAMRRHVDAPELRAADAQVGDVLAPSTRGFEDLDLAPISISVVMRPVRSGFIITPGDGDVRARHDQRRDDREGGGGGVRRHDDRRGLQLRPPFQRDLAAVLAMRSSSKPSRRNAVSIFSVWSRVASVSMTVVRPARSARRAARPT
jgi:hypothetical protein